MNCTLICGAIVCVDGVCVDSSMMDRQFQAMEERFQELLNTQAILRHQRKPKRVAKRNRPARPGDQKRQQVAELQMKELSADLQTLITTVEPLQKQTKTNLHNVYRQHAASEVAAMKRLKDWERLLEDRMRAQEEAVRTVIASRAPATVIDQPEYQSPVPAPRRVPVVTTPGVSTIWSWEGMFF